MDLHWDLYKEKEKVGSYVKLSKLVGVNKNTLQQLGRGARKDSRKVNLVHMRKLAKYFGVPEDSFTYDGKKINLTYRNSGLKNPNTTTTNWYVPKVKNEVVTHTWGSKKKAMWLLKRMFDMYGYDKTIIPNWYIGREEEMVEDMKNEGYKIEYYYTDRDNSIEEIACDGYVILVGRI